MRIGTWCKHIMILSLVAMLSVVYSHISEGYAKEGLVAKQKGFCYVTWQKDKYASRSTGHILKDLRDIGVDHIQFVVTWYQPKYNSAKIFPSYLTPSDGSLKSAIRTARKLGFRTMLKPHLDLVDKENNVYWRGDIAFDDENKWDEWFKSYEKFILRYAKMAEKEHIDLFCIGDEFVMASKETERWRKIIRLVRKVYNGRITYAAHWDTYKYIGFWDDLDYVGISAYFPLTDKNYPSLEDIMSGWKRWNDEITEFQLYVEKPILFTEIGYSCSSGVAKEPWKKGKRPCDYEMQAKCYEAFFATVWKAKWMNGVYWWHAGPSGEKHGIPNFQIAGKPAEEVVKDNYLTDPNYSF
jgi:hypothetical protein